MESSSPRHSRWALAPPPAPAAGTPGPRCPVPTARDSRDFPATLRALPPRLVPAPRAPHPARVPPHSPPPGPLAALTSGVLPQQSPARLKETAAAARAFRRGSLTLRKGARGLRRPPPAGRLGFSFTRLLIHPSITRSATSYGKPTKANTVLGPVATSENNEQGNFRQ